MNYLPRDLDEILEECRHFPADFETLLMATCDASGLPDASYAPYVEQDGDYYVYISNLNVATDNLQITGRCSLLFIEDEIESEHLFARRRLSLRCNAWEIKPDTANFGAVMQSLIEKFGIIIEKMLKFKDFHLFRLHPRNGNYVAGFAQTYSLSDKELTQIHHNEKSTVHREDAPCTATNDSKY